MLQIIHAVMYVLFLSTLPSISHNVIDVVLALSHFLGNNMVSMFNEELLVLFGLKVFALLDQYACSRIIASYIRVHGRVVVASVLSAIQSAVLLRQLLQLIFDLLLSL